MEPTLSWRISAAVFAGDADAPADQVARATATAGRARVRRRITLQKYVDESKKSIE
jgi:hypothetical protein